MLTLPVVSKRKKLSYLAIRAGLTWRQIQKQGPLFFTELQDFMNERGIRDRGNAFFRYNMIGHEGDLDMEFGIFTSKPVAGSGPIRSGLMPAGRYATTRWNGDCHKLTDVNALLVGWARETGVKLDVVTTDTGVTYANRLEVFTGSIDDILKSAIQTTEVSIKVAGE